MTLITIELADAVLAEKRRSAFGEPRPSPNRRHRRDRRHRRLRLTYLRDLAASAVEPTTNPKTTPTQGAIP